MIDDSKEKIKDKLIQYAIALDSRNWNCLDYICLLYTSPSPRD